MSLLDDLHHQRRTTTVGDADHGLIGAFTLKGVVANGAVVVVPLVRLRTLIRGIGPGPVEAPQ